MDDRKKISPPAKRISDPRTVPPTIKRKIDFFDHNVSSIELVKEYVTALQLKNFNIAARWQARMYDGPIRNGLLKQEIKKELKYYMLQEKLPLQQLSQLFKTDWLIAYGITQSYQAFIKEIKTPPPVPSRILRPTCPGHQTRFRKQAAQKNDKKYPAPKPYRR